MSNKVGIMLRLITRNLFALIFTGLVLLTSSSFSEQTVVFSVGEWEPFVSEKMENYGPTAEIMATACKKAGYKAQFEFYPWKRSYINVKTGKAIATFPWLLTEKRRIELLYHKTPLMVSKQKFFYLKEKFSNGLKISKFEDLKPYTMVGLLGYWYEKPAKKAGVKIHMVANAAQAWKMLENGRVDVYFENESDYRKAVSILEIMSTHFKILGEYKNEVQ